MSAALRDRWKSSDGRALAAEAIEHLVGAGRPRPMGFGIHDGLVDLRGLVVAPPVVTERISVGTVGAGLMEGIIDLRGARWEGLDLSDARLPSLRFFASKISDCRFDKAFCRDWRLWDTQIADSSFAEADLRESALGTWQHERNNVWRGVSFDRANLRGSTVEGALLERCTFRESKLSNVDFTCVTMRDCTFSGLVKDVLFDCREIPGRPVAGVLVNIDFSGAKLEDVEFRGCHFDGLKLPQSTDVYPIPAFPRVMRRALELLEGNSSLEARMLAAQFMNSLKLPGSDDSVDVFNRRDYLASGGEPLADLAEAVFREALADVTL